MRLRIVLVVAFCLLVSVSVASALRSPVPEEAQEAGTAPLHAVDVETAIHPGGGDPVIEVEADVPAAPAIAVDAPTPPVLPSTCIGRCDAKHSASDDGDRDHAPRPAQVAREAIQDAPPAFWWSTSVLAIGSLASKIWWLGPGRMTWAVGKVLRWGVAVPLWTRITSGYLLENKNRAAMLEYVQDHPGASIQAVQQHAGVAWGTAVYHLDRLQRAGKLVGHRSGNHHRYWASGTPEARLRHGWALLEQDTAREVAMAVATTPGAHQGAICEMAGIRAPSASKHLSRLERAGLVQKRRVSRYAVYAPTPDLERILELQGSGPRPQAAPVTVPS